MQDALLKGQSCQGTPPAGGRGSAHDSPLGERKGTFDMEDAGRNVESAFALLSQKVTKAAAARRKDRQEVIENQENDANNWNMLTATYQLEQEAFKRKQELNNVLSSQEVSEQNAQTKAEQEQTVETIQTVTGSDSAADSQAEANEKTRNTTHKKTEGKNTMKKLGQMILDLIKQGNRNRFVIHRNGEQLVDMPVTILALLLLGSFGTCAFLMVVGLFLGCRYTINGIGAVEA